MPIEQRADFMLGGVGSIQFVGGAGVALFRSADEGEMFGAR